MGSPYKTTTVWKPACCSEYPLSTQPTAREIRVGSFEACLYLLVLARQRRVARLQLLARGLLPPQRARELLAQCAPAPQQRLGEARVLLLAGAGKTYGA